MLLKCSLFLHRITNSTPWCGRTPKRTGRWLCSEWWPSQASSPSSFSPRPDRDRWGMHCGTLGSQINRCDRHQCFLLVQLESTLQSHSPLSLFLSRSNSCGKTLATWAGVRRSLTTGCCSTALRLAWFAFASLRAITWWFGIKSQRCFLLGHSYLL